MDEKSDRLLEINEADATVIRKIFSLYLHGHNGQPMGMRAISDHLNQRSLLKGKLRWGKTMVGNVLTNPLYKGEYYFNCKEGKTGKDKPKSEWVKMDVPAIVEAATFDRAREHAATRAPTKVPPRVVNSPSLLTGLLRCGACGGSMTIATGKGGKYRYYKCVTRINHGSCGGKSIPTEKLERLILERMAEKILQPKRLLQLITEMKNCQKETRSKDEAELVRLKAELKKVEDGRQRLYEAVEQGFLSADESLRERVRLLTVGHQELLTAMAGIKRSTNIPAIQPRHIEAFSQSMRNRIMDTRSGLGKQYLRLLVDQITVEDKKATITGSYHALATAIEQEKKKASLRRVPAFVPVWLPMPDKSEWFLSSGMSPWRTAKS